MNKSEAKRKYENWKKEYPGKFRSHLDENVIIDNASGNVKCGILQFGLVTGVESHSLGGNSSALIENTMATATVLCPTCLALGEPGEKTTEVVYAGSKFPPDKAQMIRILGMDAKMSIHTNCPRRNPR